MTHGGKRKGAGRRAGAKDLAAKEEVQSLSVQARAHTAAALDALVKVATKGQSEAACVSAASVLLDRGYGRPMQSVEHAGAGGGPIKHDLSGLGDEQLAQLKAILGSIAVSRGDKRGDTPPGDETER